MNHRILECRSFSLGTLYIQFICIFLFKTHEHKEHHNFALFGCQVQEQFKILRIVPVPGTQKVLAHSMCKTFCEGYNTLFFELYTIDLL